MTKKILFILLIFVGLISCKTPETDYTKTDINSISLYDFDDKPITIEEIKKQWNDRIQRSEQISAGISKLEITSLIDQKTNETTLVLLGNTSESSVKTATKLTEFKDGLKLNATVVTCKNCTGEQSIRLTDGNWGCYGDESQSDSCTKIETLRTE